MCATNRVARLRNERGIGLLAVMLLILALALLGTMAVEMVVRDMDSGRSHAQSEQALFVAEAGLVYGTRAFLSNPSWTGLPAPGRAVGAGSFTVSITSVDAEGVALPAGQKGIRARGRVGNVYRELNAIAQTTGASYILSSTAAGNAIAVSNPDWYTGKTSIYDGAPNGAYGNGGWNQPHRGIFAGFTGTGIGTGTVTRVEALLYGYVDRRLNNDRVTVRVYLNDAAQSTARTLGRGKLNARIGAAAGGYYTVDVTRVRTWSPADFAGDLELYVYNSRRGSDDGGRLYLDSVGLRVTMSGAGALIINDYREVNS